MQCFKCEKFKNRVPCAPKLSSCTTAFARFYFLVLSFSVRTPLPINDLTSISKVIVHMHTCRESFTATIIWYELWCVGIPPPSHLPVIRSSYYSVSWYLEQITWIRLAYKLFSNLNQESSANNHKENGFFVKTFIFHSELIGIDRFLSTQIPSKLPKIG